MGEQSLSNSHESRGFLDLCVSGQASADEIDDFVDAWHESNSTQTLAEFLGMTAAEYQRWVIDPASLTSLVQSHRQQTVAT